MTLSVILGVLGVSFFFLVFAYKLDEEHGLLRYALVIFSFILLLVIPASTVHDETVCEPVLNYTRETYVYGNNFTDYHWDGYTPGDYPVFLPNDDVYTVFHVNKSYWYDEFCYTKENGSRAFMSSFRIPYYVFWAYLILYLFVLGIKSLAESWKKRGKGFRINVRGKL